MAEQILLVVDDAADRKLLETILVQEGYEVLLAKDGAAALGYVAGATMDLILLDLLIPGMSGLEVCRRFKQDPATAALPIIVVTAIGQIAAQEAALTGGADDIITKPIRPDDLRVRVRAMLRVRSIRAELDRTLAYLHALSAARYADRQAPRAKVGAPLPTSIPVLLVDDEPLTREFYGDLLQEHGFQVFSAGSGPEGLEIVPQCRPEVVVLDIQMPEMSGLEVLERLRRESPELPVIMLTGYPTSQNAIAALKLGAFDFIVKGLDHILIILAVHRAVRYRRELLQTQEESARLRSRIAELEAGHSTA
jgi:two-component system cell cycle response regulator